MILAASFKKNLLRRNNAFAPVAIEDPVHVILFGTNKNLHFQMFIFIIITYGTPYWPSVFSAAPPRRFEYRTLCFRNERTLF